MGLSLEHYGSLPPGGSWGGTRTLRDGLRYLVTWSESERRPLDLEDLPTILERAVGVDTAPIMKRWMKPLAY